MATQTLPISELQCSVSPSFRHPPRMPSVRHASLVTSGCMLVPQHPPAFFGMVGLHGSRGTRPEDSGVCWNHSSDC